MILVTILLREYEMNKKIRNLLATSVLLFSFATFGFSNDVRGLQSDLESQIEKVDKASKEIDYLSKDDQATLQKELKHAKEIETSTSKSKLTDETSKLKSVLKPLKEKSKSVSDDVAAMTQLEKNVAIDQANKKSLDKLISESHEFSNYNTYYTSCQTALSKGRTQVVDTVKNQATQAINSPYIQQTDKSNLVSLLDKVKKAKDVADAFTYIDDLQSQTSKVIENTKANEAQQKAAHAKAEAEKKAAEQAAQAKAEAEKKAAEQAAQAKAEAEKKAAEQAAQAKAEAEKKAAEQVAQASTSASASASVANSGNINTTASDKWAIENGYTWQTRKGHSHIIHPGGSLPAGYHWQVQ